MNFDFLFRRRTRQATTLVLLAVAVSTMFAAHEPRLAWWAAQAGWVALGYVLVAMALLVYKRTRLMFVCLGCSAAICLFFNEIKNPDPGAGSPPALEINDSTHEFTPTSR